MGKYLNSRLFKLVTIVGVVASLLCASFIAIRNLQQNRWLEKNIIDGLPCAPPCWQGIIPGFTPSEKALEILFNSPYIKRGSIKQEGTTISGGCTWRWRSVGRRIQPGLNWQNGTVDTIQIDLTFELSTQEVIKKFGNPEAVSITGGGQPEHWYWIIDLYYPSQGIEFKAYTSEFSNYVEPTTEVGAVFLFSQMSMQDRVKDIEEGLDSPLPTDYFSDWKGYGDVAELYGTGREWP